MANPSVSDLLAHFKQQNDLLEPMVKTQDINQDFTQAPMTDAQKGEQAGIQSANAVAPTAQDALNAGQQLIRQSGTPGGIGAVNQVPVDSSTPVDMGRYPNGFVDTAKNVGSAIGNGASTAWDYLQNPAEAIGAKPWGEYLNPPSAPVSPSIGSGNGQVSTTSIQAGSNEKTSTGDNEKVLTTSPVPRQEVPQVKTPASLNQAVEQINGQEIPSQEQLQNVNAQKHQIAQEGYLQQAGQAKAIAESSDYWLNQKQQMDSKIDDVTNNIQNIQKVDPNRIFNDGNMFNKMSFLVSAMHGGLNAGGPLTNLINNDIQAQISNRDSELEADKGLVNVFMKRGDDAMSAAMNARQYYTLYAQNMQKAMAEGAALDQNSLGVETNLQYNSLKKGLADQYLGAAKVSMDVQKAGLAQSNKQAELDKDVNATNAGINEKNNQAKTRTQEDLTSAGPAEELVALNKRIKLRESSLKNLDFSKSGVNGMLRNFLKATPDDEGAIMGTLKDTITKNYPNVDPQAISDYAKDIKAWSTNYVQLLGKGRATGEQISNAINLATPFLGGNSTPESMASAQQMRDDVTNKMLTDRISARNKEYFRNKTRK